MAIAALNLPLVDVILKGVADIVGCNVDLFQVYADIGVSLHVDVMDQGFAGKVPASKLGAHLCIQIAAATGLVIEKAGRCTNEGGTVTIRVGALENSALYFEMGV
jgi:hypothetical protein